MYPFIRIFFFLWVIMTSVIGAATIDDLISKSTVISDSQIAAIQHRAPQQNTLIAPTHISLAIAMIGTDLPPKSRAEWQPKIGIRSRNQSDVNRGIMLLQSLVDDPTLQPVYTTTTTLVGPIGRIRPKTLLQFDIQRGDTDTPMSKPTLIHRNTVVGMWKSSGIALGTEMRFFRGVTQSLYYPMTLIQGKFGIAHTPTAKGIIIPIGNGRLELVIVMPTQWNPSALPLDWLSTTTPIDFTERWVTLGIPSIAFSTRVDLTETLTQTGFSSLIGPRPQSVVGAIQQLNRIELSFQAVPPGPPANQTKLPFLIDRPFLYAVRDSLSGIYILVGTIVDL